MRVFILPRCLLWSLLWSLMQIAYAAEPFAINSETRKTDYTIGSLVHQYLTVEVPKGFKLDENSLPERAQIDAIELSDVHWNVVEKKEITRYEFELIWQIFTASEVVKLTPLKPLDLVFKRDKENLLVAVPADKVIISNLLPAKMDDVLIRPYPDVAPQPIRLTPLYAVLLVSVALLIIATTYFCWRMGWISFSKTAHMPFRQAWLQIKRLKNANQAVVIVQSMQLLSRAYDRYAGYAISPEHVTDLFVQYPQLSPHKESTLAFYQDLQQVFYAGNTPQQNMASLTKLARQLSKVEMA